MKRIKILFILVGILALVEVSVQTINKKNDRLKQSAIAIRQYNTTVISGLDVYPEATTDDKRKEFINPEII